MDNWEYLGGSNDPVWFDVGRVKIFLVASLLIYFLSNSPTYRFNQSFVEGLVEAVKLVFGTLRDLQQICLDEPVEMEVASILILYEVFSLAILSCGSPQNDVDIGRKGALSLLIIVSTLEVFLLLFFIFAVCYFMRYVLVPISLLKSHCL